MPDRLILLGHIATAHGIKGDVLIKTYTEDPAGIATYGPLLATAAADPKPSDAPTCRTLEIEVRRITPKGVIAAIEGVKDRNAAEALRGFGLYVPRSVLPEAEEGEFYFEDLAGLEARDTNGETIGRIVQVLNFGAGDLLELELPGKRQTELIPFKETYVPEVDLDAGHVTILWPLPVEMAPPPEGKDDDTLAD